MPYFHDLLSDSEIDAVVAQVKQFSKAWRITANDSRSAASGTHSGQC